MREGSRGGREEGKRRSWGEDEGEVGKRWPANRRQLGAIS